MKKFIPIIILCIPIHNVVTALQSDLTRIEQTVSYYLGGGTKNDFETLKKAFHETATMKFISDSGLVLLR